MHWLSSGLQGKCAPIGVATLYTDASGSISRVPAWPDYLAVDHKSLFLLTMRKVFAPPAPLNEDPRPAVKGQQKPYESNIGVVSRSVPGRNRKCADRAHQVSQRFLPSFCSLRDIVKGLQV